jgi:hypothetical protein
VLLQGHDFGRVAAQAHENAHVGTACGEGLGDLTSEVAGGTG